ncbi:MAG: hypothetical protein GXY83_30825 [Rhodopirellula sp.]|nr:hypothetical protein [Rhodopirellula sp.]
MIPTDKNDHATVAERLKDVEKVQVVLKKAARQAILEHERAGHKVAVWRDGQVVWDEPTTGEKKAE